MLFTLVMIKKRSRRAMELADNNPFSSIADKSPLIRHHGESPKVNLLLLDVTDTFCAIYWVRIKNNETDG